jgi:uncharacterized protein
MGSMNEIVESVMWRKIDLPGHESCQLLRKDSGWQLNGVALLVYEKQPVRLDYTIDCSPDWRTEKATVGGYVGDRPIKVEISVDSIQTWRLNGKEVPGVEGCFDLDFSFSPSTNIIAIRRLGLVIGQEKETRAAWLRFPDFNLEPLPQIYRRTGANTYLFEARSLDFTAEIEVDNNVLVTSYPGLWEVEKV